MRRSRGTRPFRVKLGLFAILFQAILFGWHHHELSVSGRLPFPIVENHSTGSQAADDDADGCEICQVLHHLAAAPIDFSGPPPPLGFIAVSAGAQAASTAYGASAGFDARAPPLA